jgi:AcrR family transcriptional regulator
VNEHAKALDEDCEMAHDEVHALSPAARLVRSAIAILQTTGLHSLSVAKVLDQANASYAELYAEFGGIDGLVDAAQLAQVASRSRATLDLVEDALRDASSYEEFLQKISWITESIRNPAFQENRIIRTLVIGNTMHSPELRDALAEIQHELSNRFAAMISNGERKGLFRCVSSPRTIGVFIQAFTDGQILDEIDRVQTPTDEWVAVVDHVVRNLLLPITDEGEHP